MNSKLLIGSALASLGAVVIACTFTTERPADSSPPPSPPPPVPVAPAPTVTTTPVLDAGATTVADAGATASDAGATADAGTVGDAGTSDAGAPPKKKPLPQRDKKSAADAGAATGDGGS